MEFLIFILVLIFVTTVVIYLGIMFTDKDSWWNKKRFNKRAENIYCTCRTLKIKEINVKNKGSLFSIKVEYEKESKSISYSNPYSVTDIYINNELVCKIHKLRNVFTEYRTLEYSKERTRDEVDEIVIKAYKTSKKELNEYYNEYCKTDGYKTDKKSFYND